MLFSGSGNGTQPALSYSPAAEPGRIIHEMQFLVISGLPACKLLNVPSTAKSDTFPHHCNEKTCWLPDYVVFCIQYLLPVRMPLEGSLAEGLLDVLL